MTDKLPPNLLALFAPRPALRYLPPADHAPEDRHTTRVDGIAAFVDALHEKAEADKDLPTSESWLEARDRKQQERKATQQFLITEGVKQQYNPNEDEGIRGDAFKTLFVGRLNYKTDTKDLEREFGRFGPIERVRMVADKEGKPRGYAFVLFERERDMKAAYKESEHLSLGGRRLVVDVERGRTVAGWRPRRFGGGLGGRNYTKAAALKPMGFGAPPGPGGFRGGGFRGGFDRSGGRGFRGGGGGGGGGPRGYGGRPGGGGYMNGAPDGAPSGPRSGGGFGGGDRDRGGSGGYGRSGSDRYDDRSRSNANFEPLPPRGGGYRDRDRDRDSSYSGQKRSYEGGGYEESRQRRRY